MGAFANNLAYAKASKALLPEAVTVLGQPTALIFELPDGRGLYVLKPPSTTVLCSDAEGRQMFVLHPIRNAGRPKASDQAIEAEGLWERFTNRHADGVFNCFVPGLRRPSFVGHLVIVRYTQQKDLDDDSEGELIEWEHYFEAPDYPELWKVGKNQFFVPRGKWRIDAAGIEHADD